MSPGGVVIVIVGVWAVTQVLAGEALERLRILPWGQNDDVAASIDEAARSKQANRASSTTPKTTGTSSGRLATSGGGPRMNWL